uniref:NADH-ubiquinone oxidoreductase chain 4L n=1 Tax=Halosydna sp. YZ-2018 TaxID=2153331 RepID=A0A343W6B2_9ANNE|nr:NADH dehydrogenase subunit 4L [Harmothoe imbricata]AVW86134.1 NADH dehydrogenase subunit 4L [Halosydna sp. YZ-2018]WKB17961.1 NADH dehydrogenase subunit 4L [Harmothoe imbricata]
MTLIPTSLIPICTLLALITMISQRNHLLMTLLALEAMILNLMILAILHSSASSMPELFLAMIILTFGACEAALGLACLVKMTRSFGNDLISSSSLNSC